MRKLFTFIVLTLSLSCFAQTQAEINKAAYADFEKSDKKLNEIYQTILSEYRSDSLFIRNLKKSQRIWVQFRDAEMDMKFPAYPGNYYGSIHPVCRADYLKELTDMRIETLKNWLVDTVDGDACSGSVKTIQSIDTDNIAKAIVEIDGTIWLSSNIKKDYRIFGYKECDIYSTKMILLSVFTNEVKNNPFNCKYGAYYETDGMSDIKLKLISIMDDFLQIAVIKNGKKIDEVYMLKKWFEFEK